MTGFTGSLYTSVLPLEVLRYKGVYDWGIKINVAFYDIYLM